MKNRAIQAILRETRDGASFTREGILEKYFGEFSSANLSDAISQLLSILEVDGQNIRMKG